MSRGAPEVRALARRWPWSLAPWERDQLHELVVKWMADKKSRGDLDADLGAWLGRDIDDAHAIAAEAEAKRDAGLVRRCDPDTTDCKRCQRKLDKLRASVAERPL